MIALLIVIACALTQPLSAQSARLPSASQLFVLQGGDTPNVNSHMAVQSQWFGVDFGVVGGRLGRELARAPGSRPEDFYCWDTPVLAPVSGKVVAAADSFPDNPIGTKDAVHPAGNHVVIQQGDRFVYIAHFRRRTVSVHVGDPVTAGQVIGRCGNSGNTDFPHIHVHATHSATLGDDVGINLMYGPIHVNLAGKEFDNVEWPMLRGLWVRNPPK
jgi:murein DD-endopeptidase MepM/ murein hydrolase activator NlpD